ncbi:phosphoadenylyl-sulfate reductase [Shimia ponticola]|uniref:phosphoadenylyl-sulfate reductase n=1 Tax=Shimia ponticola TaxID=2582893 RepID=UPI0011BFD8DA|nr:phosphoadenylyl-sulfate reductase [Shimia ponticola]
MDWTAPLPQLTQNLNALLSRAKPQDVLQAVLGGPRKTAMVSSFGADSVVLLHMVSRLDRDVPILFLDTEMLFPETLRYQSEVAETLGLTNVQVIKPNRDEVFLRDTDGLLHRADTDACCHLRKTRPLQKALSGYETWITGRKRFQAATRADMPVFENEGGKRLKVNPLATWETKDIAAYIDAHNLPRHPLVARGYPSVGCAPCTHPVAPGQDPRSGRWAGQDKVECGIHFENGKFVRGTQPDTGPAPTKAPEDA